MDPGAAPVDQPVQSPGDPAVPVDAAERIVSHSLAGTRWVLWLSATALACGFGTNVVLGRAGPGLLGFYGFLTVTVSILGIFFVLGGANVVVNYLPRLAPRDKASFLASYTGIVAASSLALLGLAAAVPAILDLIYGEAEQSGALVYLALLLPVVVLQMLTWSTLQADLSLRTFGVSKGMVSIVTFAVLLIAWPAGWLADASARRYVAAAVLIGNLASVAVACLELGRRQLRAWGSPRRFLLPKGFWSFSLYFHADSMVSFVIRSADQVYVMSALGLVSLGYYRSALVLAQLANFLLIVTDRSFYSTFCNVDPDDHPRLYQRFVRLNSLGTAVIGLALLLFSGELLRLFGESATPESRTLVSLIGGAILLAYPLTNVNNSLVTARERMNLIFVNNAIGVVAAFSLYAWLGGTLGLVGVGWAFLTVQLLMLLLSSIAARRTAAVSFPIGAWVVSIVSVAAGAGTGALLDGGSAQDLVIKAGVLAAFVPLLLLTRLVSRADLEDVAALVVPGRWFARGGASA